MPTKQKKKDVIGWSFIDQFKHDYKTKPLDELITIAEAAKLRGVSTAAVTYHLRAANMRSETVAGTLMVYRSDVENYQPQKPGPKSDAA
jgi:hypothetical protein